MSNSNPQPIIASGKYADNVCKYKFWFCCFSFFVIYVFSFFQYPTAAPMPNVTEVTTPATQMASHGNAGDFFRSDNFIVNALRSAISACNLCKGTRDVRDEIRGVIRDEINLLENRIRDENREFRELVDSRIHGKYPRQLQIIYNMIIFVSQSLSFHVSSNMISALEVQNDENLRAELGSEPVPEMYVDNDGKCK
jgi:hypothetical protein